MQTINRITVFLSSPGDVQTEREIVAKTVERLNIVWVSQFGIAIDLVSWEKDSWPSTGEDAQDVLNRELPGDYDVFVGILWSRIGTQTRRAKSGTVEEFENAFRRNKESPGSVEVMLYFKNVPLNPNSIDIKQFGSVQKFKSEIKSRGVFFHEFQSDLDFERSLSLHLSQVIGRIYKSSNSENTKSGGEIEKVNAAIQVISRTDDMLNDPDIGFLDTDEIIKEAAGKLGENLDTVSNNFFYMTSSLNEITAKIKSDGKWITKETAKESSDLFDKISEGIEAVFDDLKNNQQRFCLATLKSIELRQSLGADLKSVRFLSESLEKTVSKYDQMKASLTGLIGTMDSTPKVEINFNRSKRRLRDAVKAMVDEFTVGEELLLQIKQGVANLER